MNARPFIFSILTLASAFPLQAQQERSTGIKVSGQSSAEVEDIGEIAEVSGTTSDGKSLEAASTQTDLRSKFRLTASGRAQYTTNAVLSGNHSSGDFLFFPTIEGGYSTQLRNGFALDFATRIESGLYASNGDRSFVGYGATATLEWRPRPTAPRLFISAEPYRYDNFDIGGLLTQAVGFTAGTDWGIAFNGGESAAFVGYNFTHYLSDPGIDTRNAHKAVIGITHTIRPQLYGQLFYAYNYDHYTGFDRHDSRHILGANLTWQINRQLFGSLSGSFVDNESTQDRASYQTAGAAVQLTWHY